MFLKQLYKVAEGIKAAGRGNSQHIEICFPQHNLGVFNFYGVNVVNHLLAGKMGEVVNDDGGGVAAEFIDIRKRQYKDLWFM